MTSEKIIDLTKYQSAHRERTTWPHKQRTSASGEVINLEATLKARTILAIERAHQTSQREHIGLARSSSPRGEVMFTTLRRAARARKATREFEIDPMVIAKRLLDRLLPSE